MFILAEIEHFTKHLAPSQMTVHTVHETISDSNTVLFVSMSNPVTTVKHTERPGQ